MEKPRVESWPEPLLPSPLQPCASGGLVSGWTFMTQQSPLSDFTKEVNLSVEFPISALLRLPDDAGMWAATPPENLRRLPEAAIGSHTFNTATRGTAISTKSPVSPADIQEQLHEEAEAILSDFRQNLSQSMMLCGSALRPPTNGYGCVSVSGGETSGTLPAFAGAVAAISPPHDATPPVPRANSEGRGANSFFMQRAPNCWPVGTETVASDPLRHSYPGELSVNPRMRGLQQRLNWDEDFSRGEQQPHHNSSADKPFVPSSLLAYQHAISHSDGDDSAIKRTPLVATKRPSLIEPAALNAALTPASTNNNSQGPYTFDTAGKCSMPRSGATSAGHDLVGGQPGAVQLLRQQNQHQHEAMPQGQSPSLRQQTEQCIGYSGLDLAALLSDTPPMERYSSLQTPDALVAHFPLTDTVYEAMPFQSGDEHRSAGFLEAESQDDAEAGQPCCSAAPMSMSAEQQPAARYGCRPSALPHASQHMPLSPVASVAATGWRSAASSRGLSSHAITRRPLPTPESDVVAFGHGGFYESCDSVELHPARPVLQTRQWAGACVSGECRLERLSAGADCSSEAGAMESSVGQTAERAGPGMGQHRSIGLVDAGAMQEMTTMGLGMADGGLHGWERGLHGSVGRRPYHGEESLSDPQPLSQPLSWRSVQQSGDAGGGFGCRNDVYQEDSAGGSAGQGLLVKDNPFACSAGTAFAATKAYSQEIGAGLTHLQGDLLPSGEVSWASEAELAMEPSRAWGSTASRRGTREVDNTVTLSAAKATLAADVSVTAESAAKLAEHMTEAADAAPTSARDDQYGVLQQPLHPADMEPPSATQVNTPVHVGALTAREVEGFGISLGRRSNGISNLVHCQPPMTSHSAAVPAIISAAGRDWAAMDSKAIRYNPNGFRSTCSSIELCAGGADGTTDVTHCDDGDIQAFRSWQIQVNPAYEEDLDATDASSQVGSDAGQNQLSPVADKSPLATMGVLARVDISDIACESSPGVHHGAFARDSSDCIGAAGPTWTPSLAAAAAAALGAIMPPHRVSVLPTDGDVDGSDTSEANTGRNSSHSESPRASACNNRVLAASGLDMGLGLGPGLRNLPGHRGMLHGCLIRRDAAVDEDDVGDRRDTSTNRPLGSQSGTSGPAVGGSGRGALFTPMDAEDRSLILELEHAQTLLLQALAAADEASLLTPPPPPSPAPGGGAVVAQAQADGTVGAVAMAAAAAAAEATSWVSRGRDGSQGDSDGDMGALQVSARSSRSNGVDNPLAAHVATVVMGKALARLTKLSRENQGLQRLIDELRSDLSYSSSKGIELQTRNKMLQAMLAERGRQADRKAMSHQRCCRRMDAHLNGSHQRIRELELVNTQLSLEIGQLSHQLEQSQTQTRGAEVDHAEATLREEVASPGHQKAVAATWLGTAKLQLADAPTSERSAECSAVAQPAVERLRWQVGRSGGPFDVDSAHCKAGAEAATEVGQLLPACYEARVHELEARLRVAQAQAGRVLRLEEELQAAREAMDCLREVKFSAAANEQQLQEGLKSARVAMAELAAERVAARAEALRREDDAHKAELAVQEARHAAELASANCARVAAAAGKAEQRHEVAMAELQQQLDAATWEAQQLSSQAAEAVRRAEAAETREQAALEQLQAVMLEAERARTELEAARIAFGQVDAVEDTAARSAAAVAELEMALVAESARVLDETRRRELAEAAHRTELQQLRAQLEAAAHDRQVRADAEWADLQAEHRSTQEQLYQLSVQLQAARSELQSLQQEREHLHSERARLVEAACKEAARLADARGEALSLRSSMVEVQAGQQRLLADLKATKEEARDATERLAEAQTSRRSLEVALEDLRRELVEAQSANTEVKTRLDGAEDEKSALTERVRHLWQDLDVHGSLVREAEARAGLAETAIEELRNEQLLLRSNLDALADDVANAQAVLREREGQLHAAWDELQAAGMAHGQALVEEQARRVEAEARAEAAVAACAEAEAAAVAERSKTADLEAEMQVAMRKLVELQKLAEAQTRGAAAVAADVSAAAAAGRSASAGCERCQRRLLLGSAAEVVAACVAACEEPAAPMGPPPSLSEERRTACCATWDGSRVGSLGGSTASQPASDPPSPNLQLAGQVVAAQAELADLRHRQEDAEELIGTLRQSLEDKCNKCAELEAQLLGCEGELATARRAHEDAMFQLQLFLNGERSRERAAATASASATTAATATVSAQAQAGLLPLCPFVADVTVGDRAGMPSSGGELHQAPCAASAVFSSLAWSPSSSMRVERCSMVLPLSPTCSMLRDSTALLDESRLSLPRRPALVGVGAGGMLCRESSRFFGSVKDGDPPEGPGGAFTASATPISLWVEPGSAGRGLTWGTTPATLLRSDGDGVGVGRTPMSPSPLPHGRYYYGGENEGGSVDGSAFGAAAAAAAVAVAPPHMRPRAHTAVRSPLPEASISLRARVGSGYAADADLSPGGLRGFEPLRASQSHDLDGLRASYSSVGGDGGGMATGCTPLTADGQGLLTTVDGGGGGAGGVHLTVQLLELRYAVQSVEQAAGQLAGVLLGKGRAAEASCMDTFPTPLKQILGGAAGGIGGGGASHPLTSTTSRRRPLTASLVDDAAEAARQERDWLADSLNSLTDRARSVSQQLDGCLDAALALRHAGSATAEAAEQRPSGPCSGAGQCGHQPLLSSLAVRVLEAELADLRQLFEEAQQQAEKALQQQHAQHVEECATLVADANQYRDLAQRMREQLVALDHDGRMDRKQRRDEDEELQAELRDRQAMKLEERCREQEAIIIELQQQLDRATAALAAATAVTSQQEGEVRRGHGVGHGVGRDRGSSHGSASGQASVEVEVDQYGGGCPSSSAALGLQWGTTPPAVAAAAALSSGLAAGREYHQFSASSVGEECPSTTEWNCGGGGGGSANSVSSCAGMGTTAAVEAAAAGRLISSGPVPRPFPALTPGSIQGTQDLRPGLLQTGFSYQHGGYSHQEMASRRAGRGGGRPAITDLSQGVTAAEYEETVDSRRGSSGAAAQHADSTGEDEARLWTEMLQLLKAAESGSNGGSRSRGVSASGRRHTADSVAPAPPPLLALISVGETDGGGGRQLAQVSQSTRSASDLQLVAAAAAAGSTHGRAEMLARAVSYMSLLCTQNRKLAKLLKGWAVGRAAAAAAKDGPTAVRLEAMQKEVAELREKYQAAQLAQKTSEQAMRTMGLENRQLHSQVLELINAQGAALRARSGSGGGFGSDQAVELG